MKRALAVVGALLVVGALVATYARANPAASRGGTPVPALDGTYVGKATIKDFAEFGPSAKPLKQVWSLQLADGGQLFGVIGNLQRLGEADVPLNGGYGERNLCLTATSGGDMILSGHLDAKGKTLKATGILYALNIFSTYDVKEITFTGKKQ